MHPKVRNGTTLTNAKKRVGIRTKQEAVLSLIRGESILRIADRTGISTDRLLSLKVRFIEAGRQSLKNKSLY